MIEAQPNDIAVEVVGGDAAQGHGTRPPHKQHVVLYFDRPGRAEVGVCHLTGRLVVHVYEGVKVDEEQSPRGGFGCNDGDNQSWRWPAGQTELVYLPHKVETTA